MTSAFTRRAALQGLAALSVSSASAATGNAVRLGGPIFLKSEDPGELAREHRKLGYSAAYCPDFKLSDTARIRAIEDAFKAENVAIAEVGVWCNMLDPDGQKRRENMERMIEGMARADAVGARCCVNIAGSYNAKVWYGPHPKNFSREFRDATVENCRRILDQVKPKRSKLTLEVMGWALPEGPDSYLELIQAIDRAQFAVHLDVCNGINSPARFYENGRFIEECFAKLGRYIASCHAKDLDWIAEMNVHFVEVIPGRGQVDYRPYLKGLAQLSQQPPLMIEHLSKAEDFLEGATHIRKVAKEIGITFV